MTITINKHRHFAASHSKPTPTPQLPWITCNTFRCSTELLAYYQPESKNEIILCSCRVQRESPLRLTEHSWIFAYCWQKYHWDSGIPTKNFKTNIETFSPAVNGTLRSLWSWLPSGLRYVWHPARRKNAWSKSIVQKIFSSHYFSPNLKSNNVIIVIPMVVIITTEIHDHNLRSSAKLLIFKWRITCTLSTQVSATARRAQTASTSQRQI